MALMRRMIAVLLVIRVPRMVLRHGRTGSERCTNEQSRADHAGKGRTVTTCIIPACMW